MSYGAQQVHPQGGPAIAHRRPQSGMGDFAIRDVISVQLEFKLCHSGQGTTEEEEEVAAGLGVYPAALRPSGLRRQDRSLGVGSDTGMSWLPTLNGVPLPDSPTGPPRLIGRAEDEGQGAVKLLAWVGQPNITVMTTVPKPGLKDT